MQPASPDGEQPAWAERRNRKNATGHRGVSEKPGGKFQSRLTTGNDPPPPRGNRVGAIPRGLRASHLKVRSTQTHSFHTLERTHVAEWMPLATKRPRVRFPGGFRLEWEYRYAPALPSHPPPPLFTS